MSIKCLGISTGIASLLVAARNRVFGKNEECVLRDTKTMHVWVYKQEFGVCSIMTVVEEGYPDKEGINFDVPQKIYKQVFVRPVKVDRRDINGTSKPLYCDF